MSRLKIATLIVPVLFLATAGLYAQGDDRREWSAFPRPITRVNPGFPINSRFEETRPLLSADGKFLFFARKYHPENTGGNADPQDIFYSTTTDGIHWTPARNAGRGLNTPRADNLCGIVSDNQLIFFKTSAKNHGKFVIRSNEGTAEESIGPEIVNESAYLEASFSYDRQVVLFTAKNKKNMVYQKDVDERDIYYSIQTLHGWTEPRNLGSVVNSSGDEFSPFLAADGRTLFFASNGHGGLGGADVFVTRRIGDGWADWSTPENLGPRINTSRFDGYFTVSPASRVAYMVSNANSIGKSDIIAVVLPEIHQPERYTPWQFTTLDGETATPVRAQIMVTNLEGKKIAGGVSDREGKISIFLPKQENLRVTIRSSNHFPIESALPDTTVVAEFKLRPLMHKAALKIESIFFEKSTARVLDSSVPALDQLLSMLRRYPEKNVELRGHTDNAGTLHALKELSRKRVDAVRRYLLTNGISSTRISGQAFGGLKPAVENTDEESRQKNRRVELILR